LFNILPKDQSCKAKKSNRKLKSLDPGIIHEKTIPDQCQIKVAKLCYKKFASPHFEAWKIVFNPCEMNMELVIIGNRRCAMI